MNPLSPGALVPLWQENTYGNTYPPLLGGVGSQGELSLLRRLPLAAVQSHSPGPCLLGDSRLLGVFWCLLGAIYSGVLLIVSP